MAKADGYVTPGKRLGKYFGSPLAKSNAARVFNLASKMLLAMSSMQREFHQCLVRDIKH